MDFDLQLALSRLQAVAGIGLGRVIQRGAVDHLMGAAIGWARIVQGGHFLSDVIWAGAVVYLAGELLAWAWLSERTLADRPLTAHGSPTPTPPTSS